MKKLNRWAGVLIGALALVMTGCDNKSEDRSWEIYCAKYGVSVDHPSEREYDRYLDTYAGSQEEDYDLAFDKGYMPFSAEHVVNVTRGLVCRNNCYIAYTDEMLGMERELLLVDEETYDRISVCINEELPMEGYLRLVGNRYQFVKIMEE